VDTNQRAAIYRPTQHNADSFKGLALTDEVVYLDLSDTGKRNIVIAKDYVRNQAYKPESMSAYVSAWWLPAATPNAPTIYYCHGVFRNLSYNHPKLEALRSAGFNVLAITYRGWPGTSEALPSEQSIYDDAMRGWEELKRREPDASKRIIYGHSMGGGVAVELASHLAYPKDYAALMLESTFTRLPDVAAELRWYGVLLKPFATQHFDSVDKIKAIKAPLLMRHGTADNTVPFVLGKRLFDAANEPKQFVPFEGGSHSGLHREAAEKYRESLNAFWRQASSAQSAQH
jgi:alpha-beta hydrolase superfamily lysophospholipase